MDYMKASQDEKTKPPRRECWKMLELFLFHAQQNQQENGMKRKNCFSF